MTEPHDSNSTQQLHASSATSTGKRMGVLTAYYNFVADYRVGREGGCTSNSLWVCPVCSERWYINDRRSGGASERKLC